ncbi:MAG: nucleoside-triphosphatase rdgB [Bacteroidetes bacterium OLB11]|nr:MAG: nucleoside-triphosphatase rdgB [Bacteroidetes bacterium OLB11]
MGGFQRQVLLLVNQAEWNDANEEFLKKILSSCKLNEGDYLIVLLEAHQSSFDIIRLFSPKILLLFDVPFESSFFKSNKSFNKPFIYNQIKIVITHSLGELKNDKDKKLLLWNRCIKPLFLNNELVFCTNNQHKMEEVSQIIDNQFQFLKLKDVGFHNAIEEPFMTLEENAMAKAKTVFDFCHKSCFAEDTGLFIEALDGEPGVFSARYAGEENDSQKNIEKVLQKLGQIENRKAYFKTVIALITSKGSWLFEGICNGRIALSPMGSTGFGYDPIFIPDGYSISFAEMSSEEKNKISHRKIAVEQFATFLKTKYSN